MFMSFTTFLTLNCINFSSPKQSSPNVLLSFRQMRTVATVALVVAAAVVAEAAKDDLTQVVGRGDQLYRAFRSWEVERLI